LRAVTGLVNNCSWFINVDVGSEVAHVNNIVRLVVFCIFASVMFRKLLLCD